jgi:hypothetical protein
MSQTKFVCEGNCGGSVTEEEFNQGKNVCATPGCTHEGHPLVKKNVCEGCDANLNEGEEHTH